MGQAIFIDLNIDKRIGLLEIFRDIFEYFKVIPEDIVAVFM